MTSIMGKKLNQQHTVHSMMYKGVHVHLITKGLEPCTKQMLLRKQDVIDIYKSFKTPTSGRNIYIHIFNIPGTMPMRLILTCKYFQRKYADGNFLF